MVEYVFAILGILFVASALFSAAAMWAEKGERRVPWD